MTKPKDIDPNHPFRDPHNTESFLQFVEYQFGELERYYELLQESADKIKEEEGLEEVPDYSIVIGGAEYLRETISNYRFTFDHEIFGTPMM